MHPSRSSYQLHIQWQGMRPAVWRRVMVSDRTTLAQLHQIIATAMDWPTARNSRYAFEIAGQRYGLPDADQPDDPTLDARRYSLVQLLRGQRLPMRYWPSSADPAALHRIRLEVCAPQPRLPEPCPAVQCLAGRHVRPLLAPAAPQTVHAASWTRSTQPQTRNTPNAAWPAAPNARFDRLAVQQRLDALVHAFAVAATAAATKGLQKESEHP